MLVSKSWIALIAALGIAGGGAFALLRATSAPEDAAISLVPSDAVLYTTVYIEPSDSQRANLDSVLSKLPKIDSLDKAKAELAELVDPELEKLGLEFERDIEPWLGPQAAFYMTTPEGPTGSPEHVAALIATDDQDATRAAIDKGIERSGDTSEWEDATYEGVDYRVKDEESAFGFVGDFLVAGTESGFKASVDASAGENLGGTERFTDATSLLSDDVLALFYVDSASIIEAAESAGAMGQEEIAALETFGASGAVAVSLHAEEESLVFESASELPEEGAVRDLMTSYEPGSGLIGSFPGNSWLAISLQDSGESLDAALDAFGSVVPGFDRQQIDSTFSSGTGLDLNDDVLGWMGDAGLFVQGTNLQEIGGALVVTSSDAGKTGAAVQKLQDFATANGLQTRPLERGGLTGFAVQAPGMPAPVNLLGGERFIAAYGDAATDDALDPDSTLEDSESYSAAQETLGDDYATVFYVDGQGMVRLIESGMSFSGATDPTYEEDVKPYLDHLDFMVAGVRVEGDSVVQRFALGAR